MDYKKAMSEILSTFSDESLQAITTKCNELGFDPNRGEITLDESFINLGESKHILLDAIEKNKISQFPLSIQRVLHTDLLGISGSISRLLSGSDEVVNLINAIEKLFADVWQYGFHNLSEEFLGYALKLNQLKYQATKAKELQKELEKGIDLKSDLEKLLADLKRRSEDLKTLEGNAISNNDSIKQNLDKSVENSQKTAAHLTTIETANTTITQLVASSKSSNAEISSIEGRIKEFAGIIEGYKKNIADTAKMANDVVGQNNTSTTNLIAELARLEGQIKDQIERATGHSLFHSFQTRQGRLVLTKNLWVAALAVLVATSVGITYWIATSVTEFDIGFYLKLSMSIPLIYAISFCTIQYTKERKLEEEYAFKANISISLLPYKELVEKLVDKSNPEEHSRFTDFILNSIDRVFTSPTGKVFHVNEDRDEIDPERAMKKLSATLTAVLKPFESVMKLMKS